MAQKLLGRTLLSEDLAAVLGFLSSHRKLAVSEKTPLLGSSVNKHALQLKRFYRGPPNSTGLRGSLEIVVTLYGASRYVSTF